MLKLFSVVKKDTTLLGSPAPPSKSDVSFQLGKTESESSQGKQQRWRDEIKNSLRRDLLFRSFAAEPRASASQTPRTRIVRSTTTGASTLPDEEALDETRAAAVPRVSGAFQSSVTGRVIQELDEALETVYSWEEGPSTIPRTLSNGETVKVGRLKKTYSKGDAENGEVEGGNEQEFRKMAADLAAKDVELDALKQRYSRANDAAVALKGENRRMLQASESADLSQLISTIHQLEDSLSNKEKETVNMRQRLTAIEKQLEVSQEEKERVVKELMGDAAAAATELSELREAHATKHQELSRKEEQVESMRLQLQAAEDSVALLLREKRQAEGSSQRLAESQAPLESELEKGRGEAEALERKVQEMGAVVAQKESKVQEMVALLAQKDSRSQELEALVAQKESKIQEVTASVVQKESEAQEAAALLAQQESKVQEMAALLAEKDNKIQEMTILMAQKEREAQETAALLAQKDNKVQEMEALVAQKESKVQELAALLAQRDNGAQDVEARVAQKEQAHEQEKFKFEYARKALEGEVESLKEKCGCLERLHQSAAKNEAVLAKEVEILKQEAAEQRRLQEAKDQEAVTTAATLAALQSEAASKSEELAAAHAEIEKFRAQATGEGSGEVAELKADVAAKEKQLKVFQDRLKGVEEALVSLGYEREAGAKPGQAGASGLAGAPGAASSGESDVDKAGKWVIKHCLSIEALKKEQELERKLSRREILNLQQEVEELRAAKAKKDKEAAELKEKLALASTASASGAHTAPTPKAPSTERHQKEAEAPTAFAVTPRKQMVPPAMERPSPMSVNRGAGERVKARAMELMKQTSTVGQSSSAEREKQEGQQGGGLAAQPEAAQGRRLAAQPEATSAGPPPTEPAQTLGNGQQESGPSANGSASTNSSSGAAANGVKEQVKAAEQQAASDPDSTKPAAPQAATGGAGANNKNKKRNKGRGKH